MDFKFALPFVRDIQVDDVTAFCKRVEPAKASYDDIECVCNWAGRILAALLPLNKTIVDWILDVPLTRMLMVEVITKGVISNANYIHAGRVENAIYAQMLLISTRECNPLTEDVLKPIDEPQPTKE